jgi:hypothetical protein
VNSHQRTHISRKVGVGEVLHVEPLFGEVLNGSQILRLRSIFSFATHPNFLVLSPRLRRFDGRFQIFGGMDGDGVAVVILGDPPVNLKAFVLSHFAGFRFHSTHFVQFEKYARSGAFKTVRVN